MSDPEALRALPRAVPSFHERQASHLRALAEHATTTRVKRMLLQQAEEHERITSKEQGMPPDRATE